MKAVKVLLLCLTIVYLFQMVLRNFFEYHNALHCHDEVIEDGVENVLNDAESPPPKGKSIFFHETSCNFARDRVISITPRQACAVESAAKLNPNTSVYLLYAAPVRLPNASAVEPSDDKKYRILNELLKYENVKIRRVFLEQYVKGSPLEEWYSTKQLKTSDFLNSHTSDMLRFLTLWKYGGTYLDLDVVLLKSLEDLSPNYAGAENNESVASGVMNFDHRNDGHYLVDLCLKEISTNFKADRWNHNGPGVITRVLKRVCNVEHTSLMNPQRCKGFTVYEPRYIYAIPWRDWQMFFEPNKFITALRTMRSSYIMHVWNKNSYKMNVSTSGRDVAYGLMARRYCPNVYGASGDVF